MDALVAAYRLFNVKEGGGALQEQNEFYNFMSSTRRSHQQQKIFCGSIFLLRIITRNHHIDRMAKTPRLSSFPRTNGDG
jgi:hypothetical protein